MQKRIEKNIQNMVKSTKNTDTYTKKSDEKFQTHSKTLLKCRGKKAKISKTHAKM